MAYRLSQIKAVWAAGKTQGISMRKKLFLYFASLICGLLAVVIIIFNFTGILNPTEKTFQRLLSAQSVASLSYIKHNTSTLSANTVSFSQKLSTDIKKTLSINALSFDDLHNNLSALKTIQNNTYNTVYTYMQLTPASGAFYYLNTSVKQENDSYSGIYLKFKNLNNETTINTDISMYHGFSSVARENKIALNSTWTLETEKGLFSEIDDMMQKKNCLPVPFTIWRARTSAPSLKTNWINLPEIPASALSVIQTHNPSLSILISVVLPSLP